MYHGYDSLPARSSALSAAPIPIASGSDHAVVLSLELMRISLNMDHREPVTLCLGQWKVTSGSSPYGIIVRYGSRIASLTGLRTNASIG